MKKLFKRMLLLLFWFYPASLLAQNNVSFFADSVETGHFGYADIMKHDGPYVYVGGRAFDTLTYAPTLCVVKLDDNGSTIWSYSLNKEVDKETPNTGGGSTYGGGKVMDLYVDGNYVYVLSLSIITGKRELWAINNNTGDLIWRREVADAVSLKRVNATQIGYVYSIAAGYIYELADKNTGKIVFSKTITTGARFEFDEDNAAYLFKEDSVFKYSSPTLETLIWNKKAISTTGTISAVSPQNDGYLYFFGTSGRVFCGRMRKSDGAPDWYRASPYTTTILSDQLSDFRIKADHIYLSAVHIYYGSTYTAFHILKIDRSTGTLNWEKAYTRTGTTSPPLGSPYLGLNSVDADEAGNVYASGYQNAGDSRDGQWSVIKLNAAGDFIYHATPADGTLYAGGSKGILTFVHNGRVFHGGNLNINGKVRAYLFKTDTISTFVPLAVKPVLATYQEASAVRAIRTFSASKYAVFKQTGKRATVELRNSADGTLIWSKRIGSNAYYEADKMCITADNKIAITALTHVAYQMKYDYLKRPDSISFIKFDSTGSSVFEKKYNIADRVGFRSIQLYASGDTNTILIHSQVSAYGTANTIHLFNADKAAGRVGDFDGYLGNSYFPINGTQQLLLPLSKDSTIHMLSSMGSPGYPRLATYAIFNFNTTYLTGYDEVRFKLTVDYMVVHNQAPCDTSSFLILGKQSTGSNQYLLQRFNTKSSTAMWTNTEAIGTSVEMASAAGQKVYTTGLKGNKLIIKQLNVNDGVLIWEKEITPSGSNAYYVPLDQQYNPQRLQYTICGYIADTSAVLLSQRPFYITLDAAGNIIKNWEQAPDLQQRNQLNAMAVSQFGQTLIGGSLYTSQHGRAGVMIEADQAVVPVTVVTLSFCAGTGTSLTSNITGAAYKWQQDAGSGFVDINDNSNFSGATTNILQLKNVPQSWNGYLYRCLADGASSNVFKTSITALTIPSVTITTTETTICAGTSVTFTAQPQQGGAAPSYKWLVNGIEKGTNSAAFVTTQLTNGAQVKVLIKNNDQCADSTPVSSNTISMAVNPVVTPAVTITGNNTVLVRGVSTDLAAVKVNGGSLPSLQWQDSTQTHGWANIPGAIADSLRYTPEATGNKVRGLLTSNERCVSSATVTSNAITFTITLLTAIDPDPVVQYGISVYPNPVSSELIIDPLKLSDSWETISIVTLNGNYKLLPKNIKNQTKVNIPVSSWEKGMYFVVLRNKMGKVAYMKFLKM